MSIAKTTLINLINNVPDDIQDEVEVIESLYKMVKLEKSRLSVEQKGTLSTDEVREHFANKHKAGRVTA